MAVHVPLSVEAQVEARVLMMSTNNILSPASGKPIIVPTQDMVLGLYYMTRERPFVKGEGKLFSSSEEVRIAYDADAVHLQAKIKCRIKGTIYETTVGRILLYEGVPSVIPFEDVNKVMDKKGVAALIDQCYRLCRDKETVLLADSLRTLGFKHSTKAGISICVDDMVVPETKKGLLDEAYKEVREVEEQYTEGLITSGEKYNKVVDIWAQTTERIAKRMMDGLEKQEFTSETGEKKTQNSFNPIYIMADSGARGSAQQMRQLSGMRGLMAKPSGEIIETPITANFREGLNVLQYFISTHGARKGLADTALKTANSGYLTRRLVDVAQDCVIIEHDCGTTDGTAVSALIEGGEVIESLGDRILGRVALEDVVDLYSGEKLIKAGAEVTEEGVTKIEEAGVETVIIRSVLTCKTRVGVCMKCYGRDLARGDLVSIGEAVGVIAAQAIGEPGTQLTMRTFHIGGTASRRVEQSSIEARHAGSILFVGAKLVTNKDGKLTVMNRNGIIAIADEEGRQRETYRLTYGAILKVKEGEAVKPGALLAEWDPYALPILTEQPGRVVYNDLNEGDSYREQVDEVTGLVTKVVVTPKRATAKPALVIQNSDGEEVARYLLPVHAVISVNDGEEMKAGDVLAKMPRETTKTKDITGGLPRVAELFEARKPKECAVISEIDGKVSFGKDTKGKRKVLVTPEVGEPVEYLIPRGKHISVHEGDFVRAGEALMDGSSNPHDILKVLGEMALVKYLVDEIQEVYRLQGVKLNDKHIEVIVRQMLKRVHITDPGDTQWLIDEQIERHLFEEENERVTAKGKTPATAEALLLGITKSSLSTDSFVSAASFQETTKVLTEAAVSGRVDILRGLKENVIMGRPIPAGSGLQRYKNLKLEIEEFDTGIEVEPVAQTHVVSGAA